MRTRGSIPNAQPTRPSTTTVPIPIPPLRAPGRPPLRPPRRSSIRSLWGRLSKRMTFPLQSNNTAQWASPSGLSLPKFCDSLDSLAATICKNSPNYQHYDCTNDCSNETSAFPSLYHPSAWPRYVATNAPAIPSRVVKMKPDGSFLFLG